MSAPLPSKTRLFPNPKAARRRYGPAERAVLSHDAGEDARREIAGWPGYAATPLRTLPDLARRTSVGEVLYKDESSRFGLGSFKALGGAYGVRHVLASEVARLTGREPSPDSLRRGEHADAVRGITVITATDGNHGRSVAWGARMFGCSCVVYLPSGVSANREAAIRGYGAETVRSSGNYDAAVREAQERAQRDGFFVVSDTSYEGYEEVPRLVMQGYTVLMAEALAEIDRPPTHVFVQAGVGGLAAAVCSVLWERFGEARPTVVVVEPERAACLFESAKAGRLVTLHGDLETVMAMLSCGEVSPLAWRIVEPCADFFMTVPDDAVPPAMRLLAGGAGSGERITVGESGVAGVCGLLAAAADPALRRTVGLSAESRVLTIGTEGATDPEIYESIIGSRG